MDPTTSPRAIVLLSGGLDSTTTLAIARSEDRACFCLTARYGQRHDHELEAARQVARALGATDHLVLDLDLAPITKGSALTDAVEVPKDRPDPARAGQIPATYVPARNTILLSLALAWAEVTRATEIFIGVSSVDYSGYPDCRPEFITAFDRLARVATRAAVEDDRQVAIRAPLLHLTKADTIRKGRALGVDYSLTHTCYDPGPTPGPDGQVQACGRCDACKLRLAAFREAGLEDPIRYAP